MTERGASAGGGSPTPAARLATRFLASPAAPAALTQRRSEQDGGAQPLPAPF